MKTLLLALVLFAQRGQPPPETIYPLYSSMDHKVEVEIHYNPQTLAIVNITLRNSAIRSALPIVTIKDVMGVVLYNANMNKGATVVRPTGMYSMTLDPDTKRPTHPFVFSMTIPYGTDEPL